VMCQTKFDLKTPPDHDLLIEILESCFLNRDANLLSDTENISISINILSNSDSKRDIFTV